jgi:hypothetical protein
MGSTELAGVAGPTGARGATGATGTSGVTGAEGQLAMAGSWSPYRTFNFSSYGNQIQSANSNYAREIAYYMGQHPSYIAGIDGSNQNRVNSVHDALVNAGVPAHKIHVGGFGDPRLRSDDRVEVLLMN